MTGGMMFENGTVKEMRKRIKVLNSEKKELVEAASMALSVMEVEYITNNRTDLAQFMEPLRAAIAKALGEQK